MRNHLGPPLDPSHQTDKVRARAFTLLELLALIATLTFISLLMIPARASTKSQGKSFRCLSNTKQLMVANAMYQVENSDAFPMVFHGGFIPTANDVNKPWVTGWLDWGTGTDNTNTAYLTQPRYASLAVYLGSSTNVYKCPADTYVSAAQRSRGWNTRVRSISANVYVGRGNGWTSGPGYSAGGPNNLTIYRGATKLTDLLIPGPAQTFLYMDEHPDSMNDGVLWPPNNPRNMPDAPATFHNGGASVSFADGRAEIHRWRGSTMNKVRSRGGLTGVNFVAANNYACLQGDPDLRWYSYSSPRHTTRTAAD